MTPLLIAGAGGHGCVVADTLEMIGCWRVIAFIDDRFPKLKKVGPWSVVGRFSDAAHLCEKYQNIVVAIGDNNVRIELLERYGKQGFKRPVIIHQKAYVSRYAEILDGTVVFAQATIHYGAYVGLGCIVNTASVIEHDCRIEEGTHICPGVRLAGGVSIGKHSWIGIGAVVREGVSIGNNVIVGAGAVVVKNLPNGVTAIGVPARPI